MASTCPVVPSFAGIRAGPAAGKRAMPARRAMPKQRRQSSSAVPKTPITPITPKEEDISKPDLAIDVPRAATSVQRDDGPEEGEISDDEDDHYSPREATTPFQAHSTLPLGNNFQAALAATVHAPLITPFPINTTTTTNGNPNNQQSKRDQLGTNASRTAQEPDPALMALPELRKAAQAAVMYLACSAKMSFDQIATEGIDRRVLTNIFNSLKLPIPDSSKNVPTTVLQKNIVPEAPKELKAAIPTPIVPNPEISAAPSAPAPIPSSLPPKPPAPVSVGNNQTSVVSRFNQSIPNLNIAQASPNGVTSPPIPTPPLEAVQEVSPTSQPQTARGRKRPVAADFDIEIKPALANPKQPRFGNRQHLEASHLIFDVSDNEEDEKEQKSLRLATQSVGPSRPDSTNPEKNEKLGESLRLKELEIEKMREKIKAMSRKRKLAANSETGSGPSSKPSTPLPIVPSADLLTAKETSLEKVEEFLHKTLDQIHIGTAEPEAVEAAVELATTELMDAEAKVDGMDVNTVISTPLVVNSQGKAPVFPGDSEVKDNNAVMIDASDSLGDVSGRRSSDDISFATAPIGLDTGDDDEDALGSPMDLSDLDDTSSSDSDSNDSEGDPEAEGSDSNDTSEQVSSDDSADVEMQDTSGIESLASDSASSPAPVAEDEDGYDPEARKSTLGEVSLPPVTTELPQNQSPLIIGVSEPQQITPSINGQPKKSEPGFTPYQSQLSGFRSFRYHPGYNKLVSQGYKSLTYSHHIDSELPVCDFETRGGTCNDPQCRWQHFRQMALPGALY
ncbi:hypothetical protein TWF730_006590 [Orbilia blumenaviensis]|uniref:Putative zinc-finger domain-containing protein n=1 Tax=Orbilia blumenaviensis TaxID=1796055 RepID=A0AAV9VEQ2_9PEZI